MSDDEGSSCLALCFSLTGGRILILARDDLHRLLSAAKSVGLNLVRHLMGFFPNGCRLIQLQVSMSKVTDFAVAECANTRTQGCNHLTTLLPVQIQAQRLSQRGESSCRSGDG